MQLLMVRVYDLTIFTYFFAFAHFGSELLIFRTATFGPGALSPVIVSSESTPRSAAARSPNNSDLPAVSLTWMITQYDFYVR